MDSSPIASQDVLKNDVVNRDRDCRHIFGLLVKVFIDLRALMKLSARFFLYHPNGFLRTYAVNGIEKHRSDLLIVITLRVLPPQFVELV
jgi:hypothetical protein